VCLGYSTRMNSGYNNYAAMIITVKITFRGKHAKLSLQDIMRSSGSIVDNTTQRYEGNWMKTHDAFKCY